MSFTTIEVASHGPVARITLNRPDRLNALTRVMLGELGTAVADIAANRDARVLVITGAGRGFCAGQDLRDADAVIDPAAIAAVIRDGYNPLIQALVGLPIPVIAMVNGVAAGAGCSLALAADWCSPPKARASPSPSAASAWCPTPAAAGSCRGGSAPPARWGWC